MPLKCLLIALLISSGLLAQIEEPEIDFSNPNFNPENAIFPVYNDCEQFKTSIELRKCSSEKISKFINRSFNTSLANRLGLRPGRYQIQVFFYVSTDGEIFILNVEAPHEALKKEAIRIFNKLKPFQVPGKLDGKAVRTLLCQPIVFAVNNDIQRTKKF